MFVNLNLKFDQDLIIIFSVPDHFHLSISGGRSPRSKVSRPLSGGERSKKMEEAAKARELARKRLLAAKKKGRERKASQSDQDVIEIFTK